MSIPEGETQITILRLLEYSGEKDWVKSSLISRYVKDTFTTPKGFIKESLLEGESSAVVDQSLKDWKASSIKQETKILKLEKQIAALEALRCEEALGAVIRKQKQRTKSWELYLRTGKFED